MKWKAISGVITGLLAGGCVSGLQIYLAEPASAVPEGPPEQRIQVGGGVDQWIELGTLTTAFALEGGYRYAVGYHKPENAITAEAGLEVPGAIMIFEEAAAFELIPRTYWKISLGSRKFRLGYKQVQGIDFYFINGSGVNVSGFSESVIFPHLGVSLLFGFGSPEVFTLALTLPDLILSGTLHMDRYSVFGTLMTASRGTDSWARLRGGVQFRF